MTATSRSQARRTTVFAGAVLAVGAAVAAWWTVGSNEPPPRALAGLTGDVARGAYGARLSGCIGCHTDAASGGGVLAGGAPIETAFGAFRAPNITPHETDGIGAWSLDDFVAALTRGEAPDGRHYYPSFPYAFYARLTDQDIVDLWAAVRSVPAVAGTGAGHTLSFPFNVRAALGPWKRVFVDARPFVTDPGRSEAWNRGRYLARGPAHCGACHTPRNPLGARLAEKRYQGVPSDDPGKAPPITPAALAKAGWTVDDLAYALRSGIKPSGDVFGGRMAEVVRGGSRYWSDADLRAIATYLLEGE